MINVHQLTKIYSLKNRDIIAADNISMKIEAGETCVLLGPSGCGKTTILKMLNGLVPKTSGTIEINGLNIDEVDIVDLRRTIGYVIQSVGLFPNMTIEENICLVPRMLKWDKKRSQEKARDLLALMGLDPAIFLSRYPRELSGGQQQRVGVARAIAADPPILIMDEPFGAIDPINREAIQDEFLRMQEQLKKTIVFVSHDIDEAAKMADRVALFRAGQLEQFATPDQLLAHPANDFVAGFVGSDRTLKRLPIVKVVEALDRSALSIRMGKSAAEAIAVMRGAGQDHVVVCDDEDRPLGYYTLAQLETADVAAAGAPSDLVTIALTENLRTAISTMFGRNIMWLACVDQAGRYVGEISQAAITHLLGATYRDAATGSRK